MRRYHPDADPSEEAAKRAQVINAAYAVLSDPEKRVRYDGSLAAQGLIKPERPLQTSLARRMVPGPAGFIGLAALAATATMIAISPPIGVLPQDALPSSAEPRSSRPAVGELAVAPPSISSTSLCANPAVPGLIKAEILRRAAGMRGADRTQLERTGAQALLRLDSPASRSEGGSGAAGCSAGASLDLPPGVVVDGGRTNMNAQLVFGVSQSGESVYLAGLSGAGNLVRSLATLGPAPSEPDPISPDEVAEAKPPKTFPATMPRSVEFRPSRSSTTVSSRKAAVTKPASAATKQDSSDCGSGWADRTICSSSNLTALDRQHGLLYAQSWARADETKRAALIGTRVRFQEKRNACRSEGCLTNAYVARLREISDIMARGVQQ